MSQEQRDSYVIPPNFIEGGSFFGGLFKARNVVEAVILAAGTGLPILTLSLTLTVRIILLCLTSLPLALLALIGIAGMPLSSYIILFFRFLRNRRTLSKSSPFSRHGIKSPAPARLCSLPPIKRMAAASVLQRTHAA